MTSLQDAMNRIDSAFVYDETSYPILRNLAPAERQRFALQHSLLHVQKSLGRMAAQLEAADHGGTMDPDVLRETVIKIVINTLKHASLLGMSAEDLLSEISTHLR